MSSMEQRDLVIGAVYGYDYSQIRSFVRSLRRTSFAGDICFVHGGLSSDTIVKLSAGGILLRPLVSRRSGTINSWHRFWPFVRTVARSPIGSRARRELYRWILNFALLRYVPIRDFVRETNGRYRAILVTDVRDVIFQANPFSTPPEAPIEAFLEAAVMRYAEEKMNTEWLSLNYGPGAVSALRSQRISCCGTVRGTSGGIKQYLEAFVDEIAHLATIVHGADTSIHNMLIRGKLAEQTSIVDNFEDTVATIGTATDAQLSWSSAGLLVDRQGRAVPVIHQHDRLPTVAARLEQVLASASEGD